MQAREVQLDLRPIRREGFRQGGGEGEPLPHLPPSPLSYPFLADPSLACPTLACPASPATLSPALPSPAPPFPAPPWRVPRRLRAFLL